MLIVAKNFLGLSKLKRWKYYFITTSNLFSKSTVGSPRIYLVFVNNNFFTGSFKFKSKTKTNPAYWRGDQKITRFTNCAFAVPPSSSLLALYYLLALLLLHYSDWVCTAVMSKWRYERSSRLIRNLSNCEREAWKKFRLQRDSNPWPLRYRCSALPTELWSHNCWEQVNFSGSIMPLRVIQHYSDWVCTAVMSKWRYERSSAS